MDQSRKFNRTGVTMERVAPFHAWRYQQDMAGDLSRLIAPPYDVIDSELQVRLLARSPFNVVRADLGTTTSSDTESNNQYTRAAALLADWKRSGVLGRDEEPSVTFVEETFSGQDRRSRTRRGFLALIKLHGFEDGVVFPHEFTLSGPKEDRFQLMKATEMSLSPVFLLYDLPGDEISAAWKGGPGAAEPAASVTDESGVTTEVWPTSDAALLELLRQTLADARFIIADGHHRYETALRYRDFRRADERRAGLTADSSAAYEYALAYFSNMADPGLAVYATHRLLSGLPADKVVGLPRTLGADFKVEFLTTDVGAAPGAIAAYLKAHSGGGAFGLSGPGLDGAYGLALARPEAIRIGAPGLSAAYQSLDVTILQSLVLEKSLGITQEDMAAQKNVTYVKDWGEAFKRLDAAEFQVGFFLNPTRLDQIRDVAMGGERMPQKTTYFYPKLSTGLVFLGLRDSI
jgi:uncharacterized protein (DUF1015 family)